VLLIAQAEGKQKGVRVADYLLEKPYRVEVEVRAAMGLKTDREKKRIEASLTRRLKVITHGKPVNAVLRVRRVRDENNGQLLLDDRAEKQLVQLVKKIVANCSPQIQSTCVMLPTSGSPIVITRRTSRADELASVDLSGSESNGLVMIYSRMQPPQGIEEVRRALHRKRARSQCSGHLPWVVVLDASYSLELDSEKIKEAIIAEFDDTRSLSAVAMQRRRLMTPGWGLSQSDPWFVAFSSKLFVNPKAQIPLPPKVADLFFADEVHPLQ
jgi:hypothetical protein